mmetsp:Transcript_47579/g.132288  ORF Transcript_47579/g.132288 Transcript_47579/m.132288 type:complete len:304 (+) Transcript_47579:668-1579(+)
MTFSGQTGSMRAYTLRAAELSRISLAPTCFLHSTVFLSFCSVATTLCRLAWRNLWKQLRSPPKRATVAAAPWSATAAADAPTGPRRSASLSRSSLAAALSEAPHVLEQEGSAQCASPSGTGSKAGGASEAGSMQSSMKPQKRHERWLFRDGAAAAAAGGAGLGGEPITAGAALEPRCAEEASLAPCPSVPKFSSTAEPLSLPRSWRASSQRPPTQSRQQEGARATRPGRDATPYKKSSENKACPAFGATRAWPAATRTHKAAHEVARGSARQPGCTWQPKLIEAALGWKWHYLEARSPLACEP